MNILSATEMIFLLFLPATSGTLCQKLAVISTCEPKKAMKPFGKLWFTSSCIFLEGSRDAFLPGIRVRVNPGCSSACVVSCGSCFWCYQESGQTPIVTVAEDEPVCPQVTKKATITLAWISNGVASRTRAATSPSAGHCEVTLKILGSVSGPSLLEGH